MSSSGYSLGELAWLLFGREIEDVPNLDSSTSAGAWWLEDTAARIVMDFPRKGSPGRDDGRGGDETAREYVREAIKPPPWEQAWRIVADLAAWRFVDWDMVFMPVETGGRQLRVMSDDPRMLAGWMVLDLGHTLVDRIADDLDERDDEAAEAADDEA